MRGVGFLMLRRYVIVNGLTTALLYAGVWLYTPSLPGLVQSARQSFEVYAMDHALLGPVVHRIVTVSGR